MNQIPSNYDYSANPYPVASPVDNKTQKEESGNDEKKKSTMAKIGSGIVNTYGMVSVYVLICFLIDRELQEMY